jgi:hypothetical protein
MDLTTMRAYGTFIVEATCNGRTCPEDGPEGSDSEEDPVYGSGDPAPFEQEHPICRRPT